MKKEVVLTKSDLLSTARINNQGIAIPDEVTIYLNEGDETLRIGWFVEQHENDTEVMNDPRR